MSEQRIDKLESALANLTDKFSEFIAIESGRQERDKHQLEVNGKILKHIDKFDSDYKPVIMRSKKQQAWIDFFIGRILLPAVVLSVLAAAGYNLK